jgi:hypothetical protein
MTKEGYLFITMLIKLTVDRCGAMNKLFYIILSLLVTGIVVTGCQETPKPLESTMTAPEVCQYVNQALPNNYEYLDSTRRCEYKYTASSAMLKTESYDKYPQNAQDQIRENFLPDSEIRRKLEDSERTTWLVFVDVTVELQRLIDGQWVFDPTIGNVTTYEEQYLFSETFGWVGKR